MNYLKSVLFLFLLLSVCKAQGQFMNKGDLLIGGNGNINLDVSNSDNNSFSISLNPSIATFLTSNLAVGGSLGLGYFSIGDVSSFSFGLTPLTRYYHPVGESTALFGEARVGFQVVNIDSDTFEDPDAETSVSYSLGAGLAFFLSDDVTLDLFLNYFDATDDFIDPTVNLNIGLQVFLIRSSEED